MGVLAGGRAVHLWVGPGPARRRRGGTATVWAAAAVAGLRPARCCRRPGVTASRTIESQKESSAPRRAIDGGATPSSRPVAGWLRWRSQCPHHRADIGCRAASAGPTGGVRRTGSRLRGCGCRGCPNACRAVRRLSASRCPVSGVRCPRVRWRVCRGVRCGASVSARLASARLASASALSARAGSCGARRCGAAPRFGTGDFAVVARPCQRAAGRLPKSGAIGAVEAVLGRAETSAGTWPLSWGALGRRLRPRSTACRPGQPVGAEGRPSVG
jgi:hypothetical protein